jgi:2'-5' RNA ligase
MRLFLAWMLPPETARACAALLPDADASLRRSRPEDLHVTLRFLGEVDDPAPLGRALRRVVEPAFPVLLDRWLVLPPGGPARVLGLGPDPASTARLTAVAATLDDALAGAGQGLRDHVFVPHVTLLRKRAQGPGGALPDPDVLPAPRIAGRCAALELVLSQGDHGGSRYTVLERHPLQDDGTGPS